MPAEVSDVPQSGRDQPINPSVLKTLRALQREGRPDILTTLVTLFLDGLPNLQDLDKLLIGENVREILECDLRLEQVAIARLREAIAHCESVRDFVTRDMLSDMLEGEEDQVDFIETQFDLIDRVGIENYIQLQSGSAE